MKIRKLTPIILTLVFLMGAIAVSSVKTNDAPVFKNSKPINESGSSDEAAAIEDNEMRGVWISYLELSMENERDKSEKAFRQKFENMAENSKGFGLNTLVVQVRPFSDALYKSKIYPWSHILTGEQGKNPGYDPLKIMCEICRKHGLSIHAWVNPYRVSSNNTPSKLSGNNPYCANKSLGIKTESGVILDPSNEEARKLITNGIIELAESYDIDGIQFDDYFYPEDISDKDKKQYEAYVQKMGKQNSMSLDNWRLANVNMLICNVYRAVHKTKNNVEFGISPQGNIENNSKLYADVKSWCTCNGFVDYICPQIYFSLDNPALSFENSLKSWCDLDFCNATKLYAGLAGYKAGSEADSGTWLERNDILAKEYEIIKSNKTLKGFMIYSYNSLIDDKAKPELQNLRNLLI